MRVLLAGIIVCAVCSEAVGAQPLPGCAGTVADYRVRYLGGDQFGVELNSIEPSSGWDLAFFPVPDRPEGQAASVRDLRAFDRHGRAVDIEYVGEGRWETPEGVGATRLTYTLFADHDQVDWNDGGPGKDEVGDHFDDSYVFAGHAFFLLDWDMPRCPVDVAFDLPGDWQVIAPWPQTDGGYRVADSWALGQNLFAVGADAPAQSEVGGLSLTWMMDSRLADLRPEVEAILSGLPQEYTEFWGGAPGDAFSIFFMSDYTSDGGAFWNSFALRIALPLSQADEISWHHTLGHEVMHLWNRLGRANGENVPELEWVVEGFTDYLTLKLMSRAGLIEPDMVEQRLANMIRRYRLSGLLTPNVTLRDAGVDKGAHWQLIYGGGGLVALLLDAELSQSDPEAFASVLRTLRDEPEVSADYDAFMARLDELTEGRGSELVSWIDTRPSNAELLQRLSRAGLDVSVFGWDEAYVRFPACGEHRCAPDFLAAR